MSNTVNTVSLTNELSSSYLQYAVAVYARALPDVRDGLRLASRRVLWAAHELGLAPDKPFRKSARLAGETMGRFHPHGSPYGTIVDLCLSGKHAVNLLQPHGNFGGYTTDANDRGLYSHLSNDEPASERYTEIKLSEFASNHVLADVDHLDVRPTYDNSDMEPSVLSPKLPLLLTQGVTGIAVGYASSWAPFNLREVIEFTEAVIGGHDTPTLWPDWPTGGTIIDDFKARETLATGRGTIVVTGSSLIERLRWKKTQRDCVVITELPPTVSSESLVEELGKMAPEFTHAFVDVSDESSREGVRIVVVPKQGVSAADLQRELLQRTCLRTHVSINMCALLDGLPHQFTARDAVAEWYSHRKQIVGRRIQADIENLRSEIHLLEGTLRFTSELSAGDQDVLTPELTAERGYSEAQARHIRSLRVSALEKHDELAIELHEKRQALEQIQKLTVEGIIISELRELHECAESRRTKISAQDVDRLPPVSRPRKVTPEMVIREQARKLGMQRKHMLEFLRSHNHKSPEFLSKWSKYVVAWELNQELNTADGRRRRRALRDSFRELARERGLIREFNKLWKTIEREPMSVQQRELRSQLKLMLPQESTP